MAFKGAVVGGLPAKRAGAFGLLVARMRVNAWSPYLRFFGAYKAA